MQQVCPRKITPWKYCIICILTPPHTSTHTYVLVCGVKHTSYWGLQSKISLKAILRATSNSGFQHANGPSPAWTTLPSSRPRFPNPHPLPTAFKSLCWWGWGASCSRVPQASGFVLLGTQVTLHCPRVSGGMSSGHGPCPGHLCTLSSADNARPGAAAQGHRLMVAIMGA